MAVKKTGARRRPLPKVPPDLQLVRDNEEEPSDAPERYVPPPRTYQLKVTLLESDPPIWRRLLVPGATTLARLDRVIQTAMGWTNSHLHTFTAGGVLYSDPRGEWEIPIRDERRARLSGIAREEGEAFIYEYDLGDSWRHQVLVEEVRVDKDTQPPSCLAGERACPPEDCGGVQGYVETLERLSDPDHEYQSTKIWVESMTGGVFDPEAFDLAAVNRALAALRWSPRV